MASAASVQELVKCGICLEIYRVPRKLPGCSHSFCETCIVSFIDKLKEEAKLELDFQCPVCRLPSKPPEDKEINREWVETLERDSELEERAFDLTENTVAIKCGPCDHLGKKSTPKYYCLTCEEYQCSECSAVVHASKLNRKHIITEAKSDKSKYHESSLELMTQLLTCSEHPRNQLEFFCNDHKQAVCYKCATVKHRTCTNIKEVKDMPSTVTVRTALSHVNKAVSAQADYIKQVICAYKQVEEENTMNKETLHAEIQRIKQTTMELLDNLEENLKQDCDAKIKNINLGYLDESDDLKVILNQLQTIDYTIKTCLETVSLDQAFVCTERLKRKCIEFEHKIMKQWSTARIKKVYLNINDTLKSILHTKPNDATKLASIEEKESVLTFDSLRTMQEIKKINFRSVRATASPVSPTYNNLLYLKRNDLLLVDSFHGYGCLVNDQCAEIASRVFSSTDDPKMHAHFKRLQYATQFANDKIAVSTCHNKKIYLASTKDLSVTGTIDCAYRPKCMVGLDNNAVAISWDNPIAFGVIEIHNNTYSDKIYFTTDKTGRNLKSFEYMAVDKSLGNVIQPCSIDKVVYSFSLDGDPVFTYKSEKLKEPRGVAVDNDSNIYVCDIAGGNIHVISPHGLPVKIITEGCPQKPLAISFSQQGDKFAVSEYEANWDTIHFFALIQDFS